MQLKHDKGLYKFGRVRIVDNITVKEYYARGNRWVTTPDGVASMNYEELKAVVLGTDQALGLARWDAVYDDAVYFATVYIETDLAAASDYIAPFGG